MVKEIQYVSINRVLDDIMDHPMLRDVTLEQVVRHTVRFISIHGYPKLYQDKIEDVEIEDFRGLLPCDLISIIQVKDLKTGICLRAMTDNFTPGMVPHEKDKCHTGKPKSVPFKEEYQGDKAEDVRRIGKDIDEWYIPHRREHFEEPAFKTQGRVIYTSFPEGKVGVAYKAIPVDENGYPMLVDNENYLEALEAYIKKKVFTIKFDKGEIAAGVLQNAQKDYAWAAGQLHAEFTIPSVSEAEALTRAFNTLIPQMRHFDNGFKDLGNREYLRRH